MTSTWFPFSSGCSISTVTTPLAMCLKSSRTLNSVDETIGSLFIMKLGRHALDDASVNENVLALAKLNLEVEPEGNLRCREMVEGRCLHGQSAICEE
ncbi:hypothetical protein MLD38_035309 [Melastoma candidum]|uniref:Uncharacterized protein n=1 Tax=Melastoma candidum TaxID=119954 RepID=A0ACB9MFU4_9MYRT|nr:hypothetical protein MLD38_035309 [Melastoma candidum]